MIMSKYIDSGVKKSAYLYSLQPMDVYHTPHECLVHAGQLYRQFRYNYYISNEEALTIESILALKAIL